MPSIGDENLNPRFCRGYTCPRYPEFSWPVSLVLGLHLQGVLRLVRIHGINRERRRLQQTARNVPLLKMRSSSDDCRVSMYRNLKTSGYIYLMQLKSKYLAGKIILGFCGFLQIEVFTSKPLLSGQQKDEEERGPIVQGCDFWESASIPRDSSGNSLHSLPPRKGMRSEIWSQT